MAIPDYSQPTAYGPKNSAKLVKMFPVEDVNELKMVWNLPYYGNEIGKIHLKYFVELFGYEGKNSILSYLKSEGLANFLQANKHSVGNFMTKFELCIELTEKGVKQYDRVVEAVF